MIVIEGVHIKRAKNVKQAYLLLVQHGFNLMTNLMFLEIKI